MASGNFNVDVGSVLLWAKVYEATCGYPLGVACGDALLRGPRIIFLSAVGVSEKLNSPKEKEYWKIAR